MRNAAALHKGTLDCWKLDFGHAAESKPVSKVAVGCVAVLFVNKNSVYKTLSGVDCYDVEKDALTWQGGTPVVAHPPCRLWCRLRNLSTAPIKEKELTFFALEMVRKFGGVLEHPAESSFWKAANLPMPGKVDQFGGYTFGVDQHWFGHPMRKRTWLYIVGCSQCNLPKPDFKLYSGCLKKSIHTSDREKTPVAFAKYLIEIARRCSNVH